MLGKQMATRKLEIASIVHAFRCTFRIYRSRILLGKTFFAALFAICLLMVLTLEVLVHLSFYDSTIVSMFSYVWSTSEVVF